MSQTSNMLNLGTLLPSFSLPDAISGKTITSGDFTNKKALLVMFLCSHCPYVQHVQGQLAQIGNDYAAKDLGIVAICSNDSSEYPEDSPEGLRKQAKQNHFTFPYLVDESQEVARKFRAACTPDFFLFGAGQKLAYRGQLDGSRPKNDIPADGRDLRAAIDAVLANRPVTIEQQPSVGCGIKWKKPAA